jgi:hypothetical protein
VRLSSTHTVYGLNFVHYELVEFVLVGDFDHDTSGLPQHAFAIFTPGRAATIRAISRALPGPAVMIT